MRGGTLLSPHHLSNERRCPGKEDEEEEEEVRGGERGVDAGEIGGSQRPRQTVISSTTAKSPNPSVPASPTNPMLSAAVYGRVLKDEKNVGALTATLSPPLPRCSAFLKSDDLYPEPDALTLEQDAAVILELNDSLPKPDDVFPKPNPALLPEPDALFAKADYLFLKPDVLLLNPDTAVVLKPDAFSPKPEGFLPKPKAAYPTAPPTRTRDLTNASVSLKSCQEGDVSLSPPHSPPPQSPSLTSTIGDDGYGLKDEERQADLVTSSATAAATQGNGEELPLVLMRPRRQKQQQQQQQKHGQEQEQEQEKEQENQEYQEQQEQLEQKEQQRQQQQHQQQQHKQHEQHKHIQQQKQKQQQHRQQQQTHGKRKPEHLLPVTGKQEPEIKTLTAVTWKREPENLVVRTRASEERLAEVGKREPGHVQVVAGKPEPGHLKVAAGTQEPDVENLVAVAGTRAATYLATAAATPKHDDDETGHDVRAAIRRVTEHKATTGLHDSSSDAHADDKGEVRIVKPHLSRTLDGTQWTLPHGSPQQSHSRTLDVTQWTQPRGPPQQSHSRTLDGTQWTLPRGPPQQSHSRTLDGTQWTLPRGSPQQSHSRTLDVTQWTLPRGPPQQSHSRTLDGTQWTLPRGSPQQSHSRTLDVTQWTLPRGPPQQSHSRTLDGTQWALPRGPPQQSHSRESPYKVLSADSDGLQQRCKTMEAHVGGVQARHEGSLLPLLSPGLLTQMPTVVGPDDYTRSPVWCLANSPERAQEGVLGATQQTKQSLAEGILELDPFGLTSPQADGSSELDPSCVTSLQADDSSEQDPSCLTSLQTDGSSEQDPSCLTSPQADGSSELDPSCVTSLRTDGGSEQDPSCLTSPQADGCSELDSSFATLSMTPPQTPLEGSSELGHSCVALSMAPTPATGFRSQRSNGVGSDYYPPVSAGGSAELDHSYVAPSLAENSSELDHSCVTPSQADSSSELDHSRVTPSPEEGSSELDHSCETPSQADSSSELDHSCVTPSQADSSSELDHSRVTPSPVEGSSKLDHSCETPSQAEGNSKLDHSCVTSSQAEGISELDRSCLTQSQAESSSEQDHSCVIPSMTQSHGPGEGGSELSHSCVKTPSMVRSQPPGLNSPHPGTVEPDFYSAVCLAVSCSQFDHSCVTPSQSRPQFDSSSVTPSQYSLELDHSCVIPSHSNLTFDHSCVTSSQHSPKLNHSCLTISHRSPELDRSRVMPPQSSSELDHSCVKPSQTSPDLDHSYVMLGDGPRICDIHVVPACDGEGGPVPRPHLPQHLSEGRVPWVEDEGAGVVGGVGGDVGEIVIRRRPPWPIVISSTDAQPTDDDDDDDDGGGVVVVVVGGGGETSRGVVCRSSSSSSSPSPPSSPVQPEAICATTTTITPTTTTVTPPPPSTTSPSRRCPAYYRLKHPIHHHEHNHDKRRPCRHHQSHPCYRHRHRHRRRHHHHHHRHHHHHHHHYPRQQRGSCLSKFPATRTMTLFPKSAYSSRSSSSDHRQAPGPSHDHKVSDLLRDHTDVSVFSSDHKMSSVSRRDHQQVPVFSSDAKQPVFRSDSRQAAVLNDDHNQCPVFSGDHKLTPVLSSDQKRAIIRNGSHNQDSVFSSDYQQAPVLSSDHKGASVLSSDHQQAPGFSSDRTQAPVFSSDHQQAPGFSSDRTQAPVFSSDRTQAPVFSSDRTRAPVFSRDHTQAPVSKSPCSSSISAGADGRSPAQAAPLFSNRPVINRLSGILRWSSTSPLSSSPSSSSSSSHCLDLPHLLPLLTLLLPLLLTLASPASATTQISVAVMGLGMCQDQGGARWADLSGIVQQAQTRLQHLYPAFTSSVIDLKRGLDPGYCVVGNPVSIQDSHVVEGVSYVANLIASASSSASSGTTVAPYTMVVGAGGYEDQTLMAYYSAERGLPYFNVDYYDPAELTSPYVYSLQPAHRTCGKLLGTVLKYFGWKHVSLLVSDNPYMETLASHVQIQLLEDGLTSQTAVRIRRDFNLTDALEALRRVPTSAKAILLFIPLTDMMAAFEAMAELETWKNHRVIIVRGHPFYAAMDSDYMTELGNSVVDKWKRVLDSVIIISVRFLPKLQGWCNYTSHKDLPSCASARGRRSVAHAGGDEPWVLGQDHHHDDDDDNNDVPWPEKNSVHSRSRRDAIGYLRDPSLQQQLIVMEKSQRDDALQLLMLTWDKFYTKNQRVMGMNEMFQEFKGLDTELNAGRYLTDQDGTKHWNVQALTWDDSEGFVETMHINDFPESQTWNVTVNRTVPWPDGVALPRDKDDTAPAECEDAAFGIIYIVIIFAAALGIAVIVTIIVFFVKRYWAKNEMTKGPNKVILCQDDLVFMLRKDMGKGSKILKSRSNLIEQSRPDLNKGSEANRSTGSINELSDFTQTARYNGDLVHVKELTVKNFEMKAKIYTFVRMLRDLRHENVNPYVGFLVDPERPAMVVEYCSRGSLKDMLHNEDIKLDWDFKLSLLTDLVRGLRYLHNAPLKVHGHLTSRNCVIDSRFVLKITDYGIPGFLERLKFQREMEPRDLMWTAPELLRDEILMRRGTEKGDVYSLSIIFQEVALRSEPYSSHNLTQEEILKKVKKPPPLCRPSVSPQAAPPQFIQTMKMCWSEMPDMRPTVEEVYEQFKKLTGGKKANIVDTMFKMLEKYSNDLEDIVAERTEQLEEEKKKTDQLLFRMLPSTVAESLKLGRNVEAETFNEVSIYFSDIVGFTTISALSTPMQVVALLNDLYTMFDETIDRHDVYKVETIGDAYMVVSGLPLRNENRHAGEIGTMALELLSHCGNFTIKHMPDIPMRLRIGLHTGSCVAGVVGLTMPRYCLFGDTVNTASRMESTGAAFRIHISEVCKVILDELGGYKVDYRGETELKGKGIHKTWWLVGKEGFSMVLPEPPPLAGLAHIVAKEGLGAQKSSPSATDGSSSAAEPQGKDQEAQASSQPNDHNDKTNNNDAGSKQAAADTPATSPPPPPQPFPPPPQPGDPGFDSGRGESSDGDSPHSPKGGPVVVVGEARGSDGPGSGAGDAAGSVGKDSTGKLLSTGDMSSSPPNSVMTTISSNGHSTNSNSTIRSSYSPPAGNGGRSPRKTGGGGLRQRQNSGEKLVGSGCKVKPAPNSVVTTTADICSQGSPSSPNNNKQIQAEIMAKASSSGEVGEVGGGGGRDSPLNSESSPVRGKKGSKLVRRETNDSGVDVKARNSIVSSSDVSIHTSAPSGGGGVGGDKGRKVTLEGGDGLTPVTEV